MTFSENLEEIVTLLQMWAKKREDDAPVAAGFITCAIEDLTNAVRYAKEKR